MAGAAIHDTSRNLSPVGEASHRFSVTYHDKHESLDPSRFHILLHPETQTRPASIATVSILEANHPNTIPVVPPDVESQQEIPNHNRWRKLRYSLRKPLAEFLGTLVSVTIGLSCSMVTATSDDNNGNVVTSSLGWGFASMIGIYVSGGISGAHLNPIVSIVLLIFRRLPLSRCLQYILAQFIACFCAAAIVYGTYHDAIMKMGEALDPNVTGLAFFSGPQSWVSNSTAFFTEVVASAILISCIFALGDAGNIPPDESVQAPIIGLVVSALSMAFSYNTGGCLNPVRDLGPRLLAVAVGYPKEIFTHRKWWWIWGAWGGPLLGGVIGAFLYDLFIVS